MERAGDQPGGDLVAAAANSTVPASVPGLPFASMESDRQVEATTRTLARTTLCLWFGGRGGVVGLIPIRAAPS